MFLFLLIILFTACLSEQICEDKYRQITPKHSMCLEENTSCNIFSNYKPNGELWTKYHNAIRNKLKNKVNTRLPFATNMMKLEWDDELYEMAKRYARQCKDKPDCHLCHQTEEYDVSQNFAVKKFTKEQLHATRGPADRFRRIINEWAQEINSYPNPESIIENYSPQSDYNTNWVNVLNANTYKIGCANLVYIDERKIYHEIYVCNYSPANLTGNQIYKIGSRSCTECPDNMECDLDFPNLCGRSMETTTVNEYNNITNNILWKCDFDAPDSKNCLAKQYYKDGDIKLVASEKFRQTTLQPFETTKLVFIKKIHIEDEGCFVFRYKFHFNYTNPRITITGNVVSDTVTNTDETEITGSDGTSSEDVLAIDIPWTNVDVKVGITLRSDSPIAQVIDIKELAVYKGNCSEIE